MADYPVQNKEAEITPEQVIMELEKAFSATASKVTGSHTQIECRSIRVGSYKVSQDNNHTTNRRALVSSKGVLFTLPHCVTKKDVKIVIPLDKILSVQVCFKRLPSLYIYVSPKHAGWIRNSLGMGNSPDSDLYFCPLNGHVYQKSIILLAESNLKDLEQGVILRAFDRCLSEIDYDAANKKLVDANTSQNKLKPLVAPAIKCEPIACSPKVIPETPEKSFSPATVQSPIPKSDQSSAHVQPTSATTSDTQQAQPSLPSSNDEDDESKKLLKGDWGMEIICHDLESLGEEQFLNDQIIDFWFKYMQRYLMKPADKDRTYIFSSFFYSKLTKKLGIESAKLTAAEKRHSRVAKWTKSVDIFKHDYILVPINENAHWIMAIICFPSLDGIYDSTTGEKLSELKTKKSKADQKSKGRENSGENDEGAVNSSTSSQVQGSQGDRIPNLDLLDKNAKRPLRRMNGITNSTKIKQPCILIFDSLASDVRNKIYSTLREYLRIEHKMKKGFEKEFSNMSMPGCMPNVPQQPNYCDCGIYILQYAESFFSHPIESYRIPIITELLDWFEESVTNLKRKQIYDAICTLVEKENPENVKHIPKLTFRPLAPPQKSVAPSSDSETNVVRNATAEEDVNVNVEDSSDGGNVSTPTPQIDNNVLQAVLDHDYTTAQATEKRSKVIIMPPEKISLAIKNPPVSLVQTSDISTISNNPTETLPNRTLRICLDKMPMIDSTEVNTSVSPTPVKKLPCYANANSPSQKSVTDKRFKSSSFVQLPTNPIISIPMPRVPSLSKATVVPASSSSSKTELAKTPSASSTSKVALIDSPRPIREKKDTWKVKDMKSSDVKTSHVSGDIQTTPHHVEIKGVATQLLSPQIFASIAGSVKNEVDNNNVRISRVNSVAHPHNQRIINRKDDRRSQSPSKKRARVDSNTT